MVTGYLQYNEHRPLSKVDTGSPWAVKTGLKVQEGVLLALIAYVHADLFSFDYFHSLYNIQGRHGGAVVCIVASQARRS